MGVLVVDDEAAARTHLVGLLKALGFEPVSEAMDWEQALERARELEPELVLLDMTMPGHDGRWIARKLQEMQLQARVVYVVAADEYAVAPLQQEALDYLYKPVNKDDLMAVLAGTHSATEQLHAIADGQAPQRIALKDIWFFEQEDELVLAFDGIEKHPVGLSLKQLMQACGDRFIRIHRRYLVDCHHIERLERDRLGGTHLWLRGYDQPLPVSLRMVARVRAAMHC